MLFKEGLSFRSFLFLNGVDKLLSNRSGMIFYGILFKCLVSDKSILEVRGPGITNKHAQCRPKVCKNELPGKPPVRKNRLWC